MKPQPVELDGTSRYRWSLREVVAPGGVLVLECSDVRVWLDWCDPRDAVGFEAASDVAPLLKEIYLPDLPDVGAERQVLRSLLGALACVAQFDRDERLFGVPGLSGWLLDGVELLDDLAVLAGGSSDAAVQAVADRWLQAARDAAPGTLFGGLGAGVLGLVASQPVRCPHTGVRSGWCREMFDGDHHELERALNDERFQQDLANWDRVRHVLAVDDELDGRVGGDASESDRGVAALRVVEQWVQRGVVLARSGEPGLARQWLDAARHGYHRVAHAVAQLPSSEATRDFDAYVRACALVLMDRFGDAAPSEPTPGVEPARLVAPGWIAANQLTVTELHGRVARAHPTIFTFVDAVAAVDEQVVFVRLGRWLYWWDPVAPWRAMTRVELGGYTEMLVVSESVVAAVDDDGRVALVHRGVDEPVAVEASEPLTSVAARPGGGFVAGGASGAVVSIRGDGELTPLWSTAEPLHTVGGLADGSVFAITAAGKLWLDGEAVGDLAGDAPGVSTVEVVAVAVSQSATSLAIAHLTDGKGRCTLLTPVGSATIPLVQGCHPTTVRFAPGDVNRVYLGDANGRIWLVGAGGFRRIDADEQAMTPDSPVRVIEPLDRLGVAVATTADGSLWLLRRATRRRVGLSTTGPVVSLTASGSRTFGVTEAGDLVCFSLESQMLAAPVPVAVEPDATGSLSISLGRGGAAGTLRWSPVDGVELAADRADGLVVAAIVDPDSPPDAVRQVFGSSLRPDELSALVERDDEDPQIGWTVPDLLADWARVGLLLDDHQQLDPSSRRGLVAALECGYRKLALSTTDGSTADKAEVLDQLERLVTALDTQLEGANLPATAQRRLDHALALVGAARPDLADRVPRPGHAGPTPVPVLAAHRRDVGPGAPEIGRLDWRDGTGDAELPDLEVHADTDGQVLRVTARPTHEPQPFTFAPTTDQGHSMGMGLKADPRPAHPPRSRREARTAPHATLTFRYRTLLASIVHLRADDDHLTGAAVSLWPRPTDVYHDTIDPAQPLTVDTSDMLYRSARDILAVERSVSLAAEVPTLGVATEPQHERGALSKLWFDVATQWDSLVHDALTHGAPWIAAAAAQRAWRAYLNALEHSENPPFQPHPARYPGAEGRRIAALLDVRRRDSYPLWVPAWAALAD